MPSRSFELLLPREVSWWSSVLSRFSCRCPSPQPAPVRRKLGNRCKFYPVSHHLERYWVNSLRHEACLMSEASYIPADVSSVPFLYTPTVYICTNSAVKQSRSLQRQRRGPPTWETPGAPSPSLRFILKSIFSNQFFLHFINSINMFFKYYG